MFVNSPSLKEHLNAMSILIQQLSALKSPSDDNDKKAVLLNSLEDHNDYTEVLGQLCTAREMRYEEMVAHLLDNERRRLQTSHIEDKILLARVRTNKPSSSRTSTSTLQCTYCKKTGHTANRCYKRLDDLDNKSAANYVEENPNEEPEPEAEMAMLAIDDESYDSWAF